MTFTPELDSLSPNAREREQELLEMFDEAATDISKEDLEEREFLVVGFAGGPSTAGRAIFTELARQPRDGAVRAAPPSPVHTSR
jgi:hypothetical protein